MSSDRLDDSEWLLFMTKLDAAEEEFAQGRPAAFKALWSHAADVSLCGGFGGVKCGWENVAARLDWASSKYSNGVRNREEITRTIGTDFAYFVQMERIQFRISGTAEYSNQELRVTMVFRRETDGWRIVHRHADSQVGTQPP